MAEFLLIHGSCHGAWCWRDMLPLLNQNGHSVRAIDLPAHGADTTPIGDVTFASYTDAILSAIDQPVILVGHSLAGIFISAAAEAAPDKIKRLIYLTAFLPQNGQSARDVREASPRQLLMDAIVQAPDRKSISFDPEKIEAKFYHDCPPGTLDFARANLCPEPSLPSATPVTLGTNYASVPRSCIRCSDDRAIAPEYQLTMSQTLPEKDVFAMECAHSPFFAQPGKLAQILLQIAEAP